MKVLGSPDFAKPDQVQAKKSHKAGESDKSKSSESGKSSGGAGDRVEISTAGAQMGSFMSHLSSVPDVRTEQVQALSGQISRGEYHPEASKIADALVNFVMG